ncbi:MAG: DUF2723 domain-containing protein [Bacteroidales bacterium]|nr:DUF2723 domain-containing protein [Bacteroidales bacterium]
MKQYNFLNRLVGWIVCAISAITYILTTEDSASFWDCGEFIATANKLLVGHPPGAPFFMIVGRFFAILAPSPELIAKSINIMSALASAFTILFLFWSITHLAKKIFIDDEENIEPWRIWAVMGAGVVGALAYTFSDTFWFSAVEGEVYGMSSLFTAAVFWAILKWENVADEPHSNRWIILIAYLMGLSIGVHLLNLLCIPAIVMVYYFKKYTITTANTIKAFLLSCVILAAILYGIIPGIVSGASYFELFFVNELGFAFNTGAVIYAFLLLGLLIWGIYFTFKNEHKIWNTILTSIAVIILGYSSFAMVVIRSNANPTMDQNSPEDVFNLMGYLNREQYGDCPLFYGQHFNSPVDRESMSQNEGKPVYMQKNGRYEIVDTRPVYKYTDNIVFPRMYSSDSRHVEQYKAWTNFEGRVVNVRDGEGGRETIVRPTFFENIRFFLAYQVNFMYWRYFMWNFSGRQNDIQSNGELIHGNWITGIPFIDNAMLGDQDLLPDSLKNNKGHNRYFMLPFLLGLAGLFYQAGKGKKGKQGFWIVMLLFFMTGLAIVVYLNQTPCQPRERDYAYAGSFYAFAIWIGLGVLPVVEFLRKLKFANGVSAIAASVICLLFVPCVMAQQNWDDHDRSGCTIARDLAYNYLNTCDENAIIFTNGDNDTFPLWYAQEVEGIRTDVRVCNLSYLSTWWYCDQMKRKAYDSDPLPISFTHDQYSGDRDIIYLLDRNKQAIDLAKAIDFVRSDDVLTKSIPEYAERLCFIPGRKFTLPVDSAAVLQNNVVSADYAGDIVKQMNINLSGKRYIQKNEFMVLDMLVQNNWKRPMYYAVTVGQENYVGLNNYFQLEGLAYRIAPVSSVGGQGRVDTEKMYDKVMNQFRWGFYNKPGIYLDENKTRMASNLRHNLSRLASALVEESLALADTDEAASTEKRQKAIAVLDKIQAELPDSLIPHNFFSLTLAEGYYLTGENAKGDEILEHYSLENWQELNYYMNLPIEKISTDEVQRCIAIFSYIEKTAEQFKRRELVDKLEKDYTSLLDKFEYMM